MRAPIRLVAIAALLAPVTAAAQSSDALYSRVTALTGWEIRGYSFDSLFPNTSQWRIPVVVVVPVAHHVSLDLNTNYVSSKIETAAGTSYNFV